jgi:hypothetical protein
VSIAEEIHIIIVYNDHDYFNICLVGVISIGFIVAYAFTWSIIKVKLGSIKIGVIKHHERTISLR